MGGFLDVSNHISRDIARIAALKTQPFETYKILYRALRHADAVPALKPRILALTLRYAQSVTYDWTIYQIKPLVDKMADVTRGDPRMQRKTFHVAVHILRRQGQRPGAAALWAKALSASFGHMAASRDAIAKASLAILDRFHAEPLAAYDLCMETLHNSYGHQGLTGLCIERGMGVVESLAKEISLNPAQAPLLRQGACHLIDALCEPCLTDGRGKSEIFRSLFLHHAIEHLSEIVLADRAVATKLLSCTARAVGVNASVLTGVVGRDIHGRAILVGAPTSGDRFASFAIRPAEGGDVIFVTSDFQGCAEGLLRSSWGAFKKHSAETLIDMAEDKLVATPRLPSFLLAVRARLRQSRPVV